MWVKIIVVAIVLLWLFRRRANATGVIQGEGPDFDPITASQLSSSGLNIGDEWSATFLRNNGNWWADSRSYSGNPVIQ